jgi:hypothetical protein
MSASLGGIIGIHAKPPSKHEGQRMQQGQGSCEPGGCFLPSLSEIQNSRLVDRALAPAKPACGEAATSPCAARTHDKRPAIKTRAMYLGRGASFAMAPGDPGAKSKSSKTKENQSKTVLLLPNRHRKA